jgi:hypothetical protein
MTTPQPGTARTHRRLKLALIVAVGLGVAAGVVLWTLPEIVRRVALDQVPKRTGRAVAIEDVDLNLFTGHLAVKQLRLADRESPEPFLELERFDLRLAPLALLRAHVLVREIALAGPTIRVVRTGTAEFNFSDLIPAATEPAPEPAATPGRWSVTLERLSVSRGRIAVVDRAVSPPAEWRLQDLAVDASRLSTRAGATPGQLTIRTKLDEAVIVVAVDPLQLEPQRFRGTLSLDGFETNRLDPYVYIPLGTPYRPRGGRLALALATTFDSAADGVRTASLSGSVTLEGKAMTQVGRPDPFVSASRVAVEIKEADLLARTLTVARVDIEGLDLKARRDVRGVLDLVELFTPKTGTSATAAASVPAQARPAPPPAPRTLFPVIRALAAGFEQIRIERITLQPSTVMFVDEAVEPPTSLSLTKLQARIEDLTWPVERPAAVTVSTVLPGGGTLDATGSVTVQPLDAQLALAVRNAPVEPYQAYLPVPARVSGRFNGDSENRIALRDGRLVAISRGNSWADNVEIREPGARVPAIRVERMELVGIDFDWPRRAVAARAVFRRPRLEGERRADGSMNLGRLFVARGPSGTTPPPPPDATPKGPPAGPPAPGLFETMRFEVGELRIEDGAIRFLDRTTTPAFSQDLSRLQVRLTELGNRPDRHAKLALQSVVGGDGNLDIAGEINALGAAAFLDLTGELRRFKLSSIDPYAAAAIGWVVKRGELNHKVRFKLDGAQLSAENEVVVGQLQVAPAAGGDEVKRRLGLPLGLIVALIKDQRGDIRARVPVSGTLNEPGFELRDTIWTAVKNVLANLATAPFKAVGRLFSGGEKLEEPRVDPVTFPAGSSVLTPAMEDHVLRVADLLRRAPFVNLALTSVTSGADADALKSEAVTARLRDFQKTRGLDDPAAAVAAYYAAHLPDVSLPATRDEQLALLREREPAPAARLADLGRLRVAATRERLVEVEGIPEARLTAEPGSSAAPAPPGETAAGEGRVEFTVVAAGG